MKKYEKYQFFSNNNPASILYKSTVGRYRPVSYPDGPITARYRFIKNAYWEVPYLVLCCLLVCVPVVKFYQNLTKTVDAHITNLGQIKMTRACKIVKICKYSSHHSFRQMDPEMN